MKHTSCLLMLCPRTGRHLSTQCAGRRLLCWSAVMAGMLIIASTALAETPSFPSSISFGNQTLNQPSAATSVTLKNNQAGPLIVRSLALSGDAASDYTIGGDCPVRSGMFEAKTSCTISITFTPSAAGLRSAKLTLTDNAHDSPLVISLSGSGVTSTGVVAAGEYVSNLSTSSLPENTATAGEKMVHRPVRPGATTGSGLLPGSLAPLTSTASAIGLISIVVTPINTSIGAGATQQFTATGVYSDGATANLTSEVGWNSSSTAVATINGAGLATGLAAGSTVITASYASVSSPPVASANSVTISAPPIIVSSPGALSGSTTLTVTAPALVSIAVTPANSSISAGKTQQFTATGTYSNNTQQNLTGTVIWTSSAAGIATINPMGLANAVAVGQASITATLGNISGSTSLSVTPGFISSGNLAQARQYHTATMLENGQVLIAGGADKDFDRLPYAELFDPTTGTSTVTGSLQTGRYSHTATLLNNGTVLIAGGIGANGFLNTAELFNPATGTFAPTGTMTTARAYHTATLLPNGQVLLAGGYNGLVTGSAELFDPLTGTFTATGSLQVAREYHTATLLNDGTVLIAAGYDGDVALKSAEIFNPFTGTFTELSSTLNTARFFHTATLLNNGQVLLAAGQTSSPESETASAELYDPFAQSFTTTGSMSAARYYHTATLLNNGQVLLTGGCNSADGTSCNASPLASANLFDPATGTFSATGNLDTPRTFQTATLLNNGQVLVAGGAYDGTDDLTNTTELYDAGTLTPSGLVSISLAPANPTIPQGSGLRFTAYGTFTGGDIEQLAEVTWTSSNPGVISISNDASDAGSAWAITGNSATISACAGMICGSTTASVGPPGPTSITGTSAFSSAGTLNDGRYNHTATLLNNGQVLIAGGEDSTGVSTAKAELYNPATGLFTTTGQMTIPRQQHTATLLPNGLVLIAGGLDDQNTIRNAAELYNPATGTFTATGSMAHARFQHTATLLKNGMVLMTGGFNLTDGFVQPAELYNPATGTFSLTGNMLMPRDEHTATLLNDGTVMIGGGWNDNPMQQGEIYNPSSGTFTYTAGMLNVARYSHTATLLNDGTVLLASGGDDIGNGTTSTAEIYNPVTGNYTYTGSLATGRYSHTATLLTNGLVLMAGGANNTTPALSSAELYDPSSGSFTPGSSMAVARFEHTATLMNNGLVLLVGGEDQNLNINNIAEIYDVGLLTPPGLSTISISPTSPLIPLGGSVQFTPVGNFTGGGTQQLAVVTWSSSNPLAIAVSSAGVAYAVAPGSATITACAGPVCGSTLATVGPALVGITVSPASGIVAPSSSLQFAAAGTFDDGSTHDVSALVTWGSTNQAVATISSGGQATGMNAGATTITAASGSLQGSATLTVAGFASLGDLNTDRSYATATLLEDGKVLVVGGADVNGNPLGSAELYDPYLQTFTLTGTLNTPRFSHTATLLDNGMVLIAGGNAGTSSTPAPTTAAEVYNPATGMFTSTGSMTTPRQNFTATLLPNGTVLVVGGIIDEGGDTTPKGELYNPQTGMFTFAGVLAMDRSDHTATPLPGGMVLIAGGNSSFFGLLGDAELYSTASGAFTDLPNTLQTAREDHTATLLDNGQVLITGGTAASGYTGAAELYNPYTQVFTPTGSLLAGRVGHTATLLTNGLVLIAGGQSSVSLSSTELYNAATGVFTAGSTLANSYAPYYGTATLLGTGQVLMAGGAYSTGSTTTAELYNPPSLTPPGVISIAITPGMVAIPIGTGQEFTAVATLVGGETEALPSVTWTSSNSGIISVSNDSTNAGEAFALAQGSATLTACAGAICGSTAVTVGPSLISINVTPANGAVPPGGLAQFSASGAYDNGTTQDITSLVSWSSSAPAVATVASGGLTSGLSTGSAIITASLGAVQGSATLTVISGGVVATGGMTTSRLRPTATLLNNGQVLMAGGYNSSGYQSSTELYDPNGGTFAAQGTLNSARYAHTATLLNSSLVLMAGGYNAGYSLPTAELYDASSGTSTYTATILNTPRYAHTATLLPTGLVLFAGGFDENGNPTSSAELYDPTTQTFTPTASLHAARAWHTATLMNNGLVLVAGGTNSSGAVASAEIYNPQNNTFIETGSMEYARYLHTATLLNNGQVLLAGGKESSGFLASAELYDPGTGSFNPAGSLNNARDQHAATLLNDGMVLIAGGENAEGFLAGEELYDPDTSAFTLTGNLTGVHGAPTATLLADGTGHVLIAGGYDAEGYLAGANLYQPDTLTPANLVSINVTPASPSISPGTNQQFIATGTLSDGTTQQLVSVTWSWSTPAHFVSNGTTVSNDVTNPGMTLANSNAGPANFVQYITASAGTVQGSALLEIRPTGFQYTTNGSGGQNDMTTSRYFHTATLLNNGLVLITGGCTSPNSAELYNPATQAFTATGSMNYERCQHTATLLTNGMVLVAGGEESGIGTAELYNPATGTFTVTGSLNDGRYYHTATLLNNGMVLIAGGEDGNGNILSSAELYNPATGTFTYTTGDMNFGNSNNPYARALHTATLLNDGEVLIAGGAGNNSPALNSAELYNPATETFTLTSNLTTPRVSATATLLNNGQVLIAGGSSNGQASSNQTAAELYNPSTGVFTATGSLETARSYQTATLLNDGLVLVAGGQDTSSQPLTNAELFDPATGTFAYTGGGASGGMKASREYQAATLLANGQVLITGGIGTGQNTAELY